MVQERSILKVADNSGAKIVRCFRVLGGSRKRYARVGDIIVASVQTAEPRNKLGIKKKEVVRAVVVRSKAPMRRPDGSYVRFDENAVILIDAKKLPRATRVFGPIPKELKERGYDKIVSLAPVVV
ncbi:MAG: 50S ribosomal protein L14 [Candidatus Colwellbacteria bacterium]|nr:50S ribosomal protein L14 [Candidatus Colwellbacteria bacterium]